MKVIGITVSKETAKRMIDEAPGDTVKIFYMNRDNYVHKETITKEKSEGKRLVDLAKDISYDDMEMFGILSLYGEITSERDILRNIAFPKIE
ncbi:MAG: hypothetical protein KHZ96_07620 [Coprobacillus sp.]|jgi:hypothetical protein|nr:hypothetical protein [Coprobacillus sp.]DAP47676.1 MAG TPA: hypothetical protein [Caudoviricetes sp.]